MLYLYPSNGRHKESLVRFRTWNQNDDEFQLSHISGFFWPRPLSLVDPVYFAILLFSICKNSKLKYAPLRQRKDNTH